MLFEGFFNKNPHLLYIVTIVCYNPYVIGRNSIKHKEGIVLANKSKKYKKRKRTGVKNRKKQLLINIALVGAMVVCVIIILMNTVFSGTFSSSNLNTASNGIIFSENTSDGTDNVTSTSAFVASNEVSHSVDISVKDMLLTINEYSRPGTALDSINGIVVHYTSNPGSTAEQNRDYFEGLKDGVDGTYASSHFVIGLDGEIIQCIPLAEMSYASNDRNHDTISIECCHPDETGEFTDATYESLQHLVTWLCEEFSLTSSDVIRHYDITGKICPKYFVENEDAWTTFLSSISENLTK